MDSKLIFSGLIIVFFTFGGFVISDGIKQRRDMLSSLINSLCEMESYISDSRMPLPQIYKKLAGKDGVGKMFDKMSREDCSDTKALWENSLGSLNLKKEDILPLKELAKVLGCGNTSHQKNAIAICRLGLEKRLKEAEISYEKEGKLYKKLGIYSGVLAVIFRLG